MGYVPPVIPFQYIQYGNRIAYSEDRKEMFQHVKGTKPIFSAVLHAKNEEQPFDFTKKSIPIQNKRITNKVNNIEIDLVKKIVSAPHITGKGQLLDEIT